MDDKPPFQENNPPNQNSGEVSSNPPGIGHKQFQSPASFQPSGPQQIPVNQSPASATPPQPPPPTSPPPIIEEENFLSTFFWGKILKIVAGFLVALFVLFIVFGVLIPTLTKKKDQKVNLTYWGLWEDSRVMQGVISDFERLNPNISIKYTKEDINSYRDRLAARIANGTGPDLFRFHNSWYPMLSSALSPLPENVISKKDFTSDYPKVVQTDLIKNGAIYGLPLEIDSLSLYINKDLFQAAGQKIPTTWEEFRTASKALTVKDETGKIKTAGASLGTYGNVSHAPDILSLLFVQNGADIKSLTNSQTQVVDALKFYTSFSSDNASKVWDSSLDPSTLAFSKGTLAMYFGYSWDFFTIKAAAPSLSFSIVPVPQLDKNNPTDIASYWVEGISAKSPHQKEALLFVKYLSSTGIQQKIYTEEAKTRTFGEPYANLTLAKELVADPNLSAFVTQAKFAASSYFVDNTFDNGINSKLNKYLEDAVNSTLQNTSPESATVTLFAGYSQVLKGYGK